jgi:hypothetical protein
MTTATAPRVGLLHTSPAIVADVVDVATDCVPRAAFENFVDEHLIKAFPADGSDAAETRRCLDHVLDYLDGLDLAAIQVTCTSLSPLVDAASRRLRTPTFAFDHAFADAVRETACQSPLLLVTVPTTTSASVAALDPLPVAYRYVPAAFEARMRGDLDRQNDLLEEAVAARPETDAVLLAQASLLPAVPELRRRLDVPVLHGAESAFRHLRRFLQ